MKVNPIPEGYHTITPYLAVHHVKQTISFLKQAFDAKEIQVHSLPNGQIMNAEIKVGNSMIMLGEKPAEQKVWTAMLYMYVEDIDDVFKKAIKAGGKLVMEPVDHFYGDRSGAIEDPSGNQWWIASRKEIVSAEELEKRMSAMKK
jgi:PhnB protein